jgi:hypothetical protein
VCRSLFTDNLAVSSKGEPSCVVSGARSTRDAFLSDLEIQAVWEQSAEGNIEIWEREWLKIITCVVKFKRFWRWCTTLRITGFADFVHHPELSVKDSVSETGSLSVLRWEDGDTYSVETLTNRLRIQGHHWHHNSSKVLLSRACSVFTPQMASVGGTLL